MSSLVKRAPANPAASTLPPSKRPTGPTYAEELGA